MKLNLGCGEAYKEKWVNADIDKTVKPDIVLDLNNPLPFEDDVFDCVYSSHVVEHLKREGMIGLFNELKRIVRHEKEITIRCPHASLLNGLTHPEHITSYSYRTFEIIAERLGMEVRKARLRWWNEDRKMGIITSIINKTINFLANKSIRFCERIWCYWVGGFWEIEVCLSK